METNPALIGLQIGNYRVLSQIGQGGMGAVYLAHHEVLGRKAAVKVLLPELSRDPDLIARFFNEARATARLRHRGFVEVFDSGTLPNGSAYLIMDHLRGADLGACIERNARLSVPDALAVLREVSDSVAVAHGHGIVHRDLKPDNIFLALGDDESPGAPSVVVKVLDFGIAKLTGDEGRGRPSRTRTGALLGTPLFMSPEQCRGAGGIDHRSDVYSLGCIAYNMLAGQPPFPLEGFGEIISAHLTLRPPPLGNSVPDLSPALDDLVKALLAKSPDDRPQTMDVVSARLDEIRRALPGDQAGDRDLAALLPRRAVEMEGRRSDSPFPGRVATTPFPKGLAPPSDRARVSGETKLLPSEPGLSFSSGSTFGLTASELLARGRAARSESGRTWRSFGIAATAVVVAAVGGLLWFRRGSDAPRRTEGPAVVERSAARVEAPAPSLSAPPDPKVDPGAAEPAPRVVSAADAPTPLTALVRLSSSPSEALVVDRRTGTVLGTTPISIRLPLHDGETVVELRKPGYRDRQATVKRGDSSLSVRLEKRGAGDLKAGRDKPSSDDQRKL
jgi:eukaryotic-like serine/threonine-protein kinase